MGSPVFLLVFVEKPGGSLPSPAEPPIVTLAAMGGRSRGWKAGLSLPFLVVSPELLLVPLAGGAATDNRPTPPELPTSVTAGKLEGSFLPYLWVKGGVGIGYETPRCVWLKNAPKQGLEGGIG